MYKIDEAEVLFEQFMKEYGRQYSSEVERQSKLETFKQNLHLINEKNRVQPHAVFGITQFSDLSAEEFKNMHTCLNHDLKVENCEKGVNVYNSSKSPTSFDWRRSGVVTKVKDQGECGACWAFSTTGNVEGVYAIKNKKLLEFSEQQLVDCDLADKGCDGGWMTQAMTYFKEKGVMLGSDYEYHAERRTCEYRQDRVRARVTSCTDFTGVSETGLVDLLINTAPLSVGAEVESRHYRYAKELKVIAIAADDLMGYKGGIINCTHTVPNHGVLLVGYGVEGNVPYWTFKNSWATRFGESGYFRLLRGVNSCVMMDSMIATMKIIRDAHEQPPWLLMYADDIVLAEANNSHIHSSLHDIGMLAI
ncbi:cathepsin F-like [Aphomia sociella]